MALGARATLDGKRLWLLACTVCAVIAVTGAAGGAQSDPFDDVFTTGKCKQDIKLYCSTVEPGESRIADCLTKQIDLEEKGNTADATHVSSDCKKALEQFLMERARDIVLDTKLDTACHDDLEKFCNGTHSISQHGEKVACLRQNREQLGEKCKAEVFRTMKEAADNFKLDAELSEACSRDAKLLCKDVEPGEGRVQDCLRSHSAQLSRDCNEQLFRQEVEDADDIRLNSQLQKACAEDKVKFCADVPPGGARVKDCLEDHRLEPDFSPTCKVKFEEMMMRRSMDFRLDPELAKACAKDISAICQYEKEREDELPSTEGLVIKCLQDYRDELTEPSCRRRVHRIIQRASEDIRFVGALLTSCNDDRLRFCSDTKPGQGRIIRCLQDHRTELQYECRSTLFDAEIKMSEDVEFKYQLKRACTKELKDWCKDIPRPDQGLVLQCLREHVEDIEMTEECKLEVQRDEVLSAEDYRLNYRLYRACSNDIQALCKSACNTAPSAQSSHEPCGGTVLDCLIESQENVTSDACKKEVFQIEKLQAEDWQNNAVLRKVCTEDVKKYCAKVAPGNARVHQCLRGKMSVLKPDCRKETIKIMMTEAEDLRLHPQLMVACVTEMQSFCPNVRFGGGRMFSCLSSFVGEVGFSAACEKQVLEVEEERSSNYRLDPGVFFECKDDVAAFCANEDKKSKADAEGDPTQALVLQCLIANDLKVAAPCGREVSRASKMALWLYEPNNPLTKSCDAEIKEICVGNKTVNHGGDGVLQMAVGTAARCIFDAGRPLEPNCQAVVTAALAAVDRRMVGGPITGDQGGFGNADDVVKEIKKKIEGFMPKDTVFLSGWYALVGMIAIVVVIIGLGIYTYIKCVNPRRQYTLVTKQGDV